MRGQRNEQDDEIFPGDAGTGTADRDLASGGTTTCGGQRRARSREGPAVLAGAGVFPIISGCHVPVNQGIDKNSAEPGTGIFQQDCFNPDYGVDLFKWGMFCAVVCLSRKPHRLFMESGSDKFNTSRSSGRYLK